MTHRDTGPTTPKFTQLKQLQDASLAISDLPTTTDLEALIRGHIGEEEFSKKIAEALLAKPELITQARDLFLSHEEPSVALAALRGIKSWDKSVAIEEATKLVMNPKTTLEAYMVLEDLSPNAANVALGKLLESPNKALRALGEHIESVLESRAA
jgi:hypothetical protein